MSEENKVSNEAVVDSGAENVTQEVAQNEYIAESKKYRRRAQEAENKLADLEKKLQDQETLKLKEKEEFKTLYEKVSLENESLSKKAKQWQTYEENRKTSLLEQLPEDKREHFKDKELDVLEFMVSELGSKTTNEPTARGTVKAKSPIEGWSKMSQGDKKKHWKDIIKSYTNK